MPAKLEPAPIKALLERISDLEPDKVKVIARTLGQVSVFNEVVREQIAAMEIGERYKEITQASTPSATTPSAWSTSSPTASSTCCERATNVWMKISRGDVADRFDKIKATSISMSPRPPRTRSSAST